jgi:hypothetical protein
MSSVLLPGFFRFKFFFDCFVFYPIEINTKQSKKIKNLCI